jgi:hypothetical protein
LENGVFPQETQSGQTLIVAPPLSGVIQSKIGLHLRIESGTIIPMNLKVQFKRSVKERIDGVREEHVSAA